MRGGIRAILRSITTEITNCTYMHIVKGEKVESFIIGEGEDSLKSVAAILTELLRQWE